MMGGVGVGVGWMEEAGDDVCGRCGWQVASDGQRRETHDGQT